MRKSLVLALVFTLGALVLNGDCSDGGDLLGVFKPPNYVIVSSSNTERHRRQTADDNVVNCAVAAIIASCDDSSSIQNYVNALGKCGNLAGAAVNNIESTCRKNSRREYCGEALVYVNGNCSQSSSCSANCFISLQQAGCCLNQGGTTYSGYLTACRIPEPSPCPKSNIRLPTLRADSSCDTLEEYQVTAFIANCDNIISPLLRTLKKQHNCGIIKEFYLDYCSSRNGRYCLPELNLTAGYYGGDSLGVRALEEIGRVCSSVSGCTLACNSSLNFVRNTVGCCVNSVNATFGGGVYPGLDRALQPSLWENCNVPYPKKCDAINVKWSFAASVPIILSLFWYYSNLF